MNWKFIDFFDVETDKKRGEDLNPIADYNFNQILNYNKDIFFLIGDDSNSLEGIGNPTSVIYRSMDFGRTFEKISLGKGTIRSSYLVKKTLFVILEQKERRQKGGPLYTSYVYRSDDFGTTWEKVQTFENRTVQGIQFLSENVGVITSYDEIADKVENFYTSDGGKTWVLLPVYKDFYAMSNCYFKSETEIWYVKETGLLMSYNFSLKVAPHCIVKSLPSSSNMDLFPYIEFNLKTQEPYVIYYEKDSDKRRGFIYYLNSEEKISFENGCGVIYGDMMYEHMYDEKNTFRSVYRWSYDMGKTWQEEVLEDFYLPGIPLKGYAEEGYIYMEINFYKGSDRDRGTRFAIGWPSDQ